MIHFFKKSIGKDVNMYSYSVTRHILKIRKFKKSFEKWQYSILRSILIGPYLDTDQIELSTKFDKIWTFNVSIISGPNHYNPQHLRFFEIQGLSTTLQKSKTQNWAQKSGVWCINSWPCNRRSKYYSYNWNTL